jgi:hypothetical protein
LAEEEKRRVLVENSSGWHEKTQGILQNLAALDYAEQSTREIQRPELQTLADVPGRQDTVKTISRAESIAEVRTNLSADDSKNSPILTPKKDQKDS